MPDEHKPSYEELEARLKVAYELLEWFCDDLEARDPQEYYKSGHIATCNDWFKWADNEMGKGEIKHFFSYPEPLPENAEVCDGCGSETSVDGEGRCLC